MKDEKLQYFLGSWKNLSFRGGRGHEKPTCFPVLIILILASFRIFISPSMRVSFMYNLL